jgi:hypothetical protein
MAEKLNRRLFVALSAEGHVVIGGFTSRTRPASTAQTESASGYSRRSAAGRQRPAAFPSLGDPFLRLVGVAARLDDRGGDSELVFLCVMGRDKFSVLAPLPQERSAGMYFRARTSFAHLRAEGLSLISRFPKRGSMMFVRKMDFCFSAIGAHARFKSSRTVLPLHDEPALGHRAPCTLSIRG